MAKRAAAHGVASVRWELTEDGELEGWARGPAEAASHVETTLTQAVEELVVCAQRRRVRRRWARHCASSGAEENGGGGVVRPNGVSDSDADGDADASPLLPDAQLLLASALARLALGVAALNESHRLHGTRMLLFSGRRASSRRYLVLQNWYCARYLTGWHGCSSLLATAVLDRALREPAGEEEVADTQRDAEGVTARDAERVGPLAGTLAHEVIMVVDQLMGGSNVLQNGGGLSEQELAGKGESGTGVLRPEPAPKPATLPSAPASPNHSPLLQTPPATSSTATALAQVTPLLAHLVFLRSTDRVANACALPDTLGTRGFVAAALAAELPPAFVRDCRASYPDDWAQTAVARFPHPDGRATVFDLFALWRIDSGEYADLAECVVGAWEARWARVATAARPPPPVLINSNLENWEEILDLARLPARIRPASYAFGTLADGFLPIDAAFRDEAARAADGPPAREREARCVLEHLHEISLCSVVMKAVQAEHPGVPGAAPSAIKLGDSGGEGKVRKRRKLVMFHLSGELLGWGPRFYHGFALTL